MKITQKKSSSSNHPTVYIKNMKKLSKLAGFDHKFAKANSTLIREIKALEKKLSYYHSWIKKLERSVDYIENYIEEQTGLEPGKELTDSSESSSSESEVKEIVASECGSFEGMKVKCYKPKKNTKWSQRKHMILDHWNFIRNHASSYFFRTI